MEWIKVSDQMPPERQMMLVNRRVNVGLHGDVNYRDVFDIGYINNGVWHLHSHKYIATSKDIGFITHYIKISKPKKEVQDE